jgi:hypothetical protein
VKEAKAESANPQQAVQDEAALLAAVADDQRARWAMGPELLDRIYREKNAREDADPEIKATREACRKWYETRALALAEGAGEAEATGRAQQASGRETPDFDHKQRADEIHREVMREVFGRPRADTGCKSDVGQQRSRQHARRRGGASGRPRAAATRSSVRSGDSGDAGECSEPAERLLVAVLGVAGPATARPPEHETVPIDDVDVISDLCSVPVDFRATGRVLVTTHFNQDGSVRFISERPNIDITLTNPTNGRAVTDRDVGLDKAVFKPDGTADVLSTGIHFRIKAPGQGIIFRRIGLQIIHLDENGEVRLP